MNRPAATRRLALMRHASAVPSAASDRQRELAPEGHDEARAAAVWALAQGFDPDHLLVSDATRTLQTAHATLEVWPEEPFWDATGAAYEAGPETLLDLIRQVPGDTQQLLVVGHNPTVAQLAQLLDNGEGAQVDVSRGFPPASMTIFEFAGRWLDLAFFGTPAVAHRAGDAPRNP